jgi:hypothetical protein
MSLTDWLQTYRHTVVAADPASGQLRLKVAGEGCRDLACGDRTLILDEEGRATALAALRPGDIVRLDTAPGGAVRVVVVRRAWDELTSPEF